jgi:cytochrome c peroxidase
MAVALVTYIYKVWRLNETSSLVLWVWLLLCSISCSTVNSADDALVQIPFHPDTLDLRPPSGFPPFPRFPYGALTKQGVALGRQLFFDPILSGDSTLSCSSCHQPHLAFTDGLALSQNKKGKQSKRSAPSLLNVVYHYKGLFWDGRAETLEQQAFEPVTNPIEMAATWPKVIQRLQNQPSYWVMFRQAFGIQKKTDIDSVLVVRALAQYERTLFSANAKFDQVMRKEAVFTPSEKRGWTIFFDASPNLPFSECNHCHIDPLFTNLAYENNGIQQVNHLEDFPDPGRGAITKNRNDLGKFVVPTLRNIALTAPYMHDGRFQTLQEVIDHYASGGHLADNLNPNVRVLKLQEQDKKNLIAFLHTLTDTAGWKKTEQKLKKNEYGSK